MRWFLSHILKSQPQTSPVKKIGKSGNPAKAKMRRKRPAPINISVEHGNVIVTTSPTSGSRVIYADGPLTPYTPTFANPVTCSNPICNDRSQFHLSPILPPPHNRSYSYDLPAQFSYPQTPLNRPLSLAELPGSVSTFSGTVELDTPTAPTRTSFGNHSDNMLESPPNLVSSSSRGSEPHSWDQLRLKEPKCNGKLLSNMGFSELLDVLPVLSVEEIKEFWQPAMMQVSYLANTTEPWPLPKECTDAAVNATEEIYTKEDIERVKATYQTRLDAKENELLELKQLHNARVGGLCAFISTQNESILSESNDDPTINVVKGIITEQRDRGDNSFDADKLLLSKSQEIEQLKTQVDQLEASASQRDQKLKHYKREIKLFKQDIKGYKQDEKQRVWELKEKDAQIAMLNSKVVQLLTIDSAVFTAPMTPRVEKDLPSPGPFNWHRAEVTQQQMMLRRTTTLSTAFSFTDSVETLDVVDDAGVFPIYKVDT
ncbi:hypothetical protein AJ80_00811 [Polytolypa hystricis UAMH7299]|uniref:Uncharacterized protein n=1 Tax=Polytolypa hystricis (strain UAMH7299) TaxID=1447883 RepID=A0A2B7Z2V2_POLH7|nr:hypothetical protein AJ80_00811 [Polytolypa hystricis UAMH7299]